MLAKLTLLKGSPLLVLMLAALTSMAQKKVEGKVTGPDSKPVYGATVSVKNTNIATSTTPDGMYSITLPPNSNVLVFTYVGFEVAEETIANTGGTTTVNVVMKA